MGGKADKTGAESTSEQSVELPIARVAETAAITADKHPLNGADSLKILQTIRPDGTQIPSEFPGLDLIDEKVAVKAPSQSEIPHFYLRDDHCKYPEAFRGAVAMNRPILTSIERWWMLDEGFHKTYDKEGKLGRKTWGDANSDEHCEQYFDKSGKPITASYTKKEEGKKVFEDKRFYSIDGLVQDLARFDDSGRVAVKSTTVYSSPTGDESKSRPLRSTFYVYGEGQLQYRVETKFGKEGLAEQEETYLADGKLFSRVETNYQEIVRRNYGTGRDDKSSVIAAQAVSMYSDGKLSAKTESEFRGTLRRERVYSFTGDKMIGKVENRYDGEFHPILEEGFTYADGKFQLASRVETDYANSGSSDYPETQTKTRFNAEGQSDKFTTSFGQYGVIKKIVRADAAGKVKETVDFYLDVNLIENLGRILVNKVTSSTKGNVTLASLIDDENYKGKAFDRSFGHLRKK